MGKGAAKVTLRISNGIYMRSLRCRSADGTAPQYLDGMGGSPPRLSPNGLFIEKDTLLSTHLSYYMRA
jgi:hypothetical protein